MSLADTFPVERCHVLEAPGHVYRVDAEAKERGLNAAAAVITRPSQ